MRHYLCLILLFFCLFCSAQQQNWESIKNNSLYLYGEGWGNTVDEADQSALSALVSKICVTVASDIRTDEKETISNGNLDSKSSVNIKLQTYAGAVLTNTEFCIISNEPDAHVGRYIKRSEISKIFEGRKRKIDEFVGLAQTAESKGKIDDCLRYYYWAYVLVQSLQYPNEATYTGKDGVSHLLSVWLPAQLNDVFDGIKEEISGKIKNDLQINFTYQGKPIENIDYTYFDGQGWSNIYSAANGQGIIELANSGNYLEQIQIKYEFEYKGQAHLDKEMQLVLNAVKIPAMRKAYHWVKIPKSIPDKARPLSVQDKELKTAMDAVIRAIQSQNHNEVQAYCTEQGWDMFQRLVSYGKGRIVGSPTLLCESHREEIIVRGLTMAFSPKNGLRDAFVEELVFTFDKDKKIDALAFSLGKGTRDAIMRHENWLLESRKDIVCFLENYKTAFALKRLDYIRSILDDNAVIIVGRVLRNVPVTKGDVTTYQSVVQKNRITKDQYVRNLETSFKGNEFINIRFTDTEVKKGRPDLEDYGIQIRQDYYSTHYGDAGYLFLKVDLNDPEKPIIRVRTWQERPDPIDGIYGLYHF